MTKKCTKCGFQCDKEESQIEKFFGFRMSRKKRLEQPQCRWCRNKKENPYQIAKDSPILITPDRERTKLQYRKEYPNDKQVRGWKRMAHRLIAHKGYKPTQAAEAELRNV